MNAQEALDDLLQTLYADETIGLNLYNYIENRLKPLQQLIDQSNAKPKTLEELGWKCIEDEDEFVHYNKNREDDSCSVLIIDKGEVTVLAVLGREIIQSYLTNEEILAIAEKMKELGMAS